MEICLRYFSDPGFQNGASEIVGVSQPTVSRTVKYVIERIVAKRDVWIIFPTTTQDFNQAAQFWAMKKRFPYCFGAVDGCLIKVQVPPRRHNPQQYYSGRKKFHCFNVQAICDADYKFLDVDASWPGKVHDARIWRNSAAYRTLSTGVSGRCLLIGDSAYTLSPFLMKPFPAAQTATDPAKKAFNDVLTSDRSTIEHSFGQVKSRFQMLRVPNRVSIEMVPKFIIACCVLHNVGKYLGDDWEDDKTDERDNNDNDPDSCDPHPDSSADGGGQVNGQEKRAMICSIINSARH